MMTKKLAEPTVELIQSGKISECQSYEFKGRVNLDEQRGKSNFIDDVVAFLNAGPGHIIIGVHEKKGTYERFEPINKDKDKDTLCRQLTSIIQDNIDPKPLHIDVLFLDVDGGFLVDISLPENRWGPYQNKITGRFYRRTGAQNTPVSRDQFRALFTTLEQMEADTIALLERENAVIEARDIMQKNGATLHIAIVPLEHYERERAPFDPGTRLLRTMRHYHGGSDIFKGCGNGFEVRDSSAVEGRATSRFFICDDWQIHSYVAHPIAVNGFNQIDWHTFQNALPDHLQEIQNILDDSGIKGPFCLLLAVNNLQRDTRIAWAFPNADTATMVRPMRVERVDDRILIKQFLDKVSGVSNVGR
jgi:hypothetical protein